MFAQEIKSCPLFAGIDGDELDALLDCLTASKRSYAKNEFIFMADDKAVSVGIVLTGKVYVIQEDYWGNRMILSHVGPSGMFGEALSCVETERLPVSVVAAESTTVLLIDYRRIVTSCSSTCVFHTRLIMNMLRILAEKNIMLTEKIEHISKRTIREKVLSFLSVQAVREGSGTIEPPFNRQELADYLCIDRSALSRELTQMQNEGLIRYERNRFELLG